MPSSHLILGRSLLLLLPILPSIRVFFNESTLRMRWPKYWSFTFSIIPSKEIPGLISFRMDWLDLLASQGYGFSSSYVWMWEVDYKESWAQKNWCFWTVVLEKTLESPLNCKEIQPVHPKGNQSWCSLEGLMLKLKLQYFGHLMPRADSFEKTPMLGKIEGRRKRGRKRMRWLDDITNSMDMSLGGL